MKTSQGDCGVYRYVYLVRFEDAFLHDANVLVRFLASFTKLLWLLFVKS
jgi:hypothetical protein